MLKLWGRTSSINVRKALWALQECGAPFERLDAGLQFGVVDTPAYRARNPNALVPLLDDDGFTLWESNVVVRYLCCRFGAGTLYPTELRRRFDAERWMDWQQTTVNRAGRDAFLQMVRTPAERRDVRLVEQSVAAMEPLLAMLDAHLAQRPHMAGDEFTMADIPLGCELHRWWGTPVAHRPFEHVRRWYDGLLARPAARGVLDLKLS